MYDLGTAGKNSLVKPLNSVMTIDIPTPSCKKLFSVAKFFLWYWEKH